MPPSSSLHQGPPWDCTGTRRTASTTTTTEHSVAELGTSTVPLLVAGAVSAEMAGERTQDNTRLQAASLQTELSQGDTSQDKT